MQFLTLNEVAAQHPRYYRVSFIAPALGTVVTTALLGASAWFAVTAWHGLNLRSAIGIWLVFWLGVVWLLALNDLRKAVRPTAWLAVVANDGLFIKWRSYQNIRWGSDGPQALFLPWREISRARRLDKTWVTHGSRTTQRHEKLRYVEIDVAGSVPLAALRDILANERAGKPGGVPASGRWGHLSITCKIKKSIYYKYILGREGDHENCKNISKWAKPSCQTA